MSIAACPPDPTGNFALPRGRVTFVDAPNRPSVDVELARTAEHRARGLMYRTDMPENAGMLFTWDRDGHRTLWMHNTCMTFDMVFIDGEGVIAGVLENVPPLNDYFRSVPYLVTHVLEVHAGWARAHGVQQGQRVQID
jgi:uncharacterized membrane protein (UPF0127 family)